jgi:hypothetical protein
LHAAKETGYKVIVDAGNGKVHYTSEDHSMTSFAPWKGHEFLNNIGKKNADKKS